MQTLQLENQVLIVEQSKLFKKMLTELMLRHDLCPVACHYGYEALEIANKQRFNLICISYHLPDMAGDQLCQQLRSNPDLKNTRIILFTAEDNTNLLKDALLAGANDIFNKHAFDSFQFYIERFASEIQRHLAGRILLVEDSFSQQQWIRAVLENVGLTVDAYSNAEDAMQAFMVNQYDIVITDILLAGNMSGINLVRAIRRLPNPEGLTPIFAITAYDEVSRRIELFQIGGSDYMAKPLNQEEMLFRISGLIKSQQLYKQLESERETLQKVAMLDSLTKTYNRTAFNELAPKALSNATREMTPVSMVIMDIDYFKHINDEFGHDRGDRVLKDTAEWLRNSFRQGDLVFRWGGEEFVILLHNCSMSEARNIIEKQRISFEKYHPGNLSVSASFGISSLEQFDNGFDISVLFNRADKALYNAKQQGRNRVECAE